MKYINITEEQTALELMNHPFAAGAALLFAKSPAEINVICVLVPTEKSETKNPHRDISREGFCPLVEV